MRRRLRYRKRIRLPGYLSAPLRRIRPIHIIIAAAVVAAAAALLIVLLSGQSSGARETSFYGREKLRVGVVVAGDAFSQKDSAGNITGFEPEFLSAVIDRAYPGAEIEFSEIKSQQASYLLKNGSIDLAVGKFCSDVLKTRGLSLTDAYYLDRVYAFVRPADAPKGLSILSTAPALIMYTEVSEKSVKDGLEELGYADIVCTPCSSYPDALSDLNAGISSAVIGPYYKMTGFDAGRIEQPVCTAGYRIAAWTEDSSSAKYLSRTISALTEDGTRDALLARWSLLPSAE